MSTSTNPYGVPDDEYAAMRAKGSVEIAQEGEGILRITFNAGTDWTGESGSFVLPVGAAERLAEDLPYQIKAHPWFFPKTAGGV